LSALIAIAFAASVHAAALVLSGPIDSTGSTPYQSTMVPGSRNAELAAAHNYMEQEFFLSGRANVYRYTPARQLEVGMAGVPYTTRLLITLPRDPTQFNGKVYLTPFHPQRGMGFWEAIRDYVYREGDAWVGIMVGTDERSREASVQGEPVDAVGVLHAWSPERYASINWPRDDGIRWDVFGQVARLLRADDTANPLHDLKIKNLYALGWSFTGSLLRTFINEGFHDKYRQASGAPAIDGYLVGISNYHFISGYVPINSKTPPLGVDDPRRIPKPVDVPVIELMTENEAVTKSIHPVAQRDTGIGRYRVYEVPGLTHGDGLHDDSGPSDCPFPQSDVPFRQITWAVLENLDLWVREGIPPPMAQPLEVNPGRGQAVKDGMGNALGGIRPAQIAVPLASYDSPADHRCQPRAPHYLAIRRIPLNPEKFQQLYPGGPAEYLQRFEACLDGLIKQRWILPEDRDAQFEAAREAASRAFPAEKTISTTQSGR
jgi:hypothetical protein